MDGPRGSRGSKSDCHESYGHESYELITTFGTLSAENYAVCWSWNISKYFLTTRGPPDTTGPEDHRTKGPDLHQDRATPLQTKRTGHPTICVLKIVLSIKEKSASIKNHLMLFVFPKNPQRLCRATQNCNHSQSGKTSSGSIFRERHGLQEGRQVVHLGLHLGRRPSAHLSLVIIGLLRVAEDQEIQVLATHIRLPEA